MVECGNTDRNSFGERSPCEETHLAFRDVQAKLRATQYSTLRVPGGSRMSWTSLASSCSTTSNL